MRSPRPSSGRTARSFTELQAGKHFVVMGQAKSQLPKAAEGVVASADGRRVTYWCREGERGEKQRMVVNGQAGPYFERVSRLSVDPETGAYAYTGLKRATFQVVTPRGASPAYDAALWQPRIREDGRMVGYVALIKDKLWWKVTQLSTDAPPTVGASPTADRWPEVANALVTARTVAVIGGPGSG
jgi:hypothetical protein